MDRKLTTPEDLLPRIEAKDMTITEQEIFEAVCVHLSRQKKRAMLPDGSACAYRGEGGTKCAAGCLIPDSLYVSGYEGNCASIVVCEWSEGSLISLDRHASLLEQLQSIHDGPYARNDASTQIALQAVARGYKLNASFINDLTFTEAA